MPKHLLSFNHWSSEQINNMINLAVKVKRSPQDYSSRLAGKSIVALFEKPSLRTRVSFDIGINKLGGHFVYLDAQANGLQGRETMSDMAANLSCWADAIIARVYTHATLLELSRGARVPVINALCERYHPCQALADFVTLSEQFKTLKGVTLAYLGDGNNVAQSLLLMAAKLGVNMVIATPESRQVANQIKTTALQDAKQSGATLIFTHDPNAIRGVDVLYTDTWISMGDDLTHEQATDLFQPFKLDSEMMSKSSAQFVMHCQPAHRDVEIASDIMDSSASLLMKQAENRMHAQNALLLDLVG